MRDNPQTILIEKEGVRKRISIPEWETLFGVKCAHGLVFENPKIRSKIIRKTEKLHRKGELSRQQLWFGSFYKQEMDSNFIPDVSLRYINPIIGWGVFAEKDFKNGEYIAEYAGLLRKSKRKDRTNAYCFEYTLANGVKTSYTIDAQDLGNIARFLNHSETPNILSALATRDMVSHVVLIAQRAIKKGEQLCYDYGTDYWSHRESPDLLELFQN